MKTLFYISLPADKNAIIRTDFGRALLRPAVLESSKGREKQRKGRCVPAERRMEPDLRSRTGKARV